MKIEKFESEIKICLTPFRRFSIRQLIALRLTPIIRTGLSRWIIIIKVRRVRIIRAYFVHVAGGAGAIDVNYTFQYPWYIMSWKYYIWVERQSSCAFLPCYCTVLEIRSDNSASRNENASRQLWKMNYSKSINSVRMCFYFQFRISFTDQFASLALKFLIAKAKMAFITSLLLLMKYFGVLPEDCVENIRSRELILFFVCSLPMMLVLIPSIAYLIAFFHTISVLDLTDLIVTIFIYGCIWSGYLIIANSQIRFRDLINELKMFVAKSEYTHTVNLFGAKILQLL